MDWSWILSPLAQYGMLAAGLIACLTLFITVKFEMSAVVRRVEKSEKEMTARLQADEAAMESLRETNAEAGERQIVGFSGLNLTRRAQVIRMRRRGEHLATIAAALGAPRNEVELLIKLHELQQQHPN